MRKNSAFLIVLLLASPAYASCLTPTQWGLVQNMSVVMNVSNVTLTDFFEGLCNRTDPRVDALNQSISDLNTSLTGMINSTNLSLINETQILNSTFTNLTQALNISAVNMFNQSVNNTLYANWNSSSYAYVDHSVYELNNSMESQFGIWEDQVSNFTNSVKNQLTDEFDTKLTQEESMYVTQDQFYGNFTNMSNTLYQYQQSQFTPWDEYGRYMFWLAVVAIVSYVLLSKFRPNWLKPKNLVKTGNPAPRGLEEMTTKTDLKARADRMRELKLQIVDMKIPKELKAKLAKMVDEDAVTNEDELNAELKILKGK